MLTLIEIGADSRDDDRRTSRGVIVAVNSHGIVADSPARRRLQPHRPTPRLARWARGAFFGIREFGSGALVALRHADAAGAELVVHPDEHLGGSVVRAQSKDQLSSMLDQAPGAVDEFLHHGLDAPTLGAVAYRGVWPEQSTPAHPDAGCSSPPRPGDTTRC